MKIRVAAVLLILFGLSAGSVFAQKYEVDPYAGGFFPTSSESVGRFRNEGMYGLRGGRFFGDLHGRGWYPRPAARKIVRVPSRR